MSVDSPNIEWCEIGELQTRVTAHIKDVFSVLDIGCGIRPQQFVIPQLLICVEPHFEYVEILKKNLQDADAFIIPLDALRALAAFPDRSVDSIFMIDVIEHMPKEVGLEVIRECERVARVQTILFTPLGFMPQETLAGEVDGWNLHGGEWQDHKSGWYPEDFPNWNIVACKHLHALDVKGQKIDPPYGGFYAIKSQAKVANYFNDEYSREVLGNSTSSLNKLKTIFPKFIDHVVTREVKNSHLRCGLQAGQKATELLIELGAEKSHVEIMQQVSRQKTADFLVEARNFNAKIDEVAAEFFDFNSREHELTLRCQKIESEEASILDRHLQLEKNEALVLTREAVISQTEKNLLLREEDIREKEHEISLREQNVDKSLIEIEKLTLAHIEITKIFYNSRLVKIISKMKAIFS